MESRFRRESGRTRQRQRRAHDGSGSEPPLAKQSVRASVDVSGSGRRRTLRDCGSPLNILPHGLRARSEEAARKEDRPGTLRASVGLLARARGQPCGDRRSQPRNVVREIPDRALLGANQPPFLWRESEVETQQHVAARPGALPEVVIVRPAGRPLGGGHVNERQIVPLQEKLDAAGVELVCGRLPDSPDDRRSTAKSPGQSRPPTCRSSSARGSRGMPSSMQAPTMSGSASLPTRTTRPIRSSATLAAFSRPGRRRASCQRASMTTREPAL